MEQKEHDIEHEINRLLEEWRDGSEHAFEELFPLVYRELHASAQALLRCERADHTLQPTALVHEAYLRLTGSRGTGWKDRLHFLAIASKVMRRILVDHARRNQAAKRGSGKKMSLEDVQEPSWELGEDLIAIDLAIQRLTDQSSRQARIVELHFFGGLTMNEIAKVLEVSRATVLRDWREARLWLRAEMGGSSTDT